MSQTPWWALPLVAGLFAVGGGIATSLVASRTRSASRDQDTDRRRYVERWTAYVGLLAAFQLSTARMRRGFEAGTRTPDLMRYHGEVGAALAQVRLVASLPVRNAALAVHRLMEDLHEPRPVAPGGASSDHEFLERLAHVPLLLQAFEVAVREELAIDQNWRPPVAVRPARGPGLRSDVTTRGPATDRR